MRKPTLQDVVEYWGVSGFARTTRLLPPRAMVLASSLLGIAAFDVCRYRRAVAARNIKKHLDPCLAKGACIKIGRRSCIGFVRTMAEFSRLPLVDQPYIDKHISFHGLRHLDEALRQGKGAILVTGHFGSWELMGCVLVRLGYPVTFVVGHQRNALVEQWMNQTRRASGIEVIEPESRIAILRVLKANGFIAMLSDQDAGRKGVFVQFLGEQASTHQGAARLAIMTGSPIMPGFIVRAGGTKHRVVIEQAIYPDRVLKKEDAVLQLTQAYTAVIEKYVQEYPDHWLWAHRRWKTRPIQGRMPP